MVEASPRGRPISWVWVFLMIAFFIVGGVGLASSWPVFWVGLGGFVLVGLISLFTGILRDVH